MNIAVPREVHADENRVALIPEHVAKLAKAGADVSVEAGLGQTLRCADEEYVKAGAGVTADRDALLRNADMVLRIRKPGADEVELMKQGCVYISLLDPFNERDLIERFVARGITAISMEMIPRITRAQKMDVLSSQANLAGYAAVVLAAERLDKILPMMMTPAGTIAPARVFVIGVGVAGLQAIATAKRLGARVEAFDTRPVVEEQVKSLGARFVKIDLGETGQTKDGYAKALTDEQLQKQRAGMAKVCASSDIVITTAQLFGRKAPLIVTGDMVAGMQKGSVIVDLAVESGGNVAGSQVGREVEVRRCAHHRSGESAGKSRGQRQSNVFFEYVQSGAGILESLTQKRFELKFEDEIAKGCVITHQGEIVNEMIRNHYTDKQGT